MPESKFTLPRLEWSETPQRRETFLLSASAASIGRRADADLVLNHPLVSRLHARIISDEQTFVLLDLASSHGTWINGDRVERHSLLPGDRIRLGEQGIELIFCTGEPAAIDQSSEIEMTMMGLGLVGSTPDSRGMLLDAEVERSVKEIAGLLPGDQSELEKISCLLDFHYSFGKAFSAERTFQHILKSALGISGAERGFILRKEHGTFAFAGGIDSAGKSLTQPDFHHSVTVVARVANGGQAVFMTQGIHGDLAGSDSIVAMNLRAIACLPLENLSADGDSSDVMGILYLDSRNYMHALSGLDEKLLTRLAQEAGHVLEKLDLVMALAEKKNLEQELAVAEETQRSLLPRSLPQAEPFRISAFSRPTRQLGGDFYDFIAVKNMHLTGVLADVSGKGIPAALLSSLALGALNMEFRSHSEPGLVLNAVNKLLCDKTPSHRFVTAFLFQLDGDGTGEYISAGHNPAYLYRAATGQVEELPSDGLPLGMFPFALYDPTPLRLDSGDVLVVYSDGLSEAENGAQQEFSEERLRDLIRLSAPGGAALLKERVLSALDQFTGGAAQTDDITFLLIEKHA